VPFRAVYIYISPVFITSNGWILATGNAMEASPQWELAPSPWHFNKYCRIKVSDIHHDSSVSRIPSSFSLDKKIIQLNLEWFKVFYTSGVLNCDASIRLWWRNFWSSKTELKSSPVGTVEICLK
jgi:hypothetical protein